jgi:hypothetical protein
MPASSKLLSPDCVTVTQDSFQFKTTSKSAILAVSVTDCVHFVALSGKLVSAPLTAAGVCGAAVCGTNATACILMRSVVTFVVVLHQHRMMAISVRCRQCAVFRACTILVFMASPRSER